MSEIGREFTPADVEFAVISMAHLFFGEEFSDDQHGYQLALAALDAQHAQIQPPVADSARITEIVVERNPIIEVSHEMAGMAAESDDYDLGLATTNNLFLFGEADYQDSLGGQTFVLSLDAHVELARSIVEKFSEVDSYLKVAGNQVFEAAMAEYRHGDAHEALAMLRGLIHTTALNGTLGEGAKARFDPYAVFQKAT